MGLALIGLLSLFPETCLGGLQQLFELCRGFVGRRLDVRGMDTDLFVRVILEKVDSEGEVEFSFMEERKNLVWVAINKNLELVFENKNLKHLKIISFDFMEDIGVLVEAQDNHLHNTIVTNQLVEMMLIEDTSITAHNFKSTAIKNTSITAHNQEAKNLA